MAQDFKRYSKPAVGISPATVHTSNSNDALVGISISNILGSTILVDCYMTGGTGGSETVYLVKTAPIPSGGALQVLAGGAKFNMQSGRERKKFKIKNQGTVQYLHVDPYNKFLVGLT